MAIIQASGHLKGEATTQAVAGLRISASAQCIGRASAANGAARAALEAQGIVFPPETPSRQGS
jgi:hypothetical protein